jgi:hypothetical protein
LDVASFDEHRGTYQEALAEKKHKADEVQKGEKSGATHRYVTLLVVLALAFILAFVGTFYGASVQNALFPTHTAASQAVSSEVDPTLRNAPMDIQNGKLQIYILWPSANILPAFREASMNADPSAPVCGTLDPGKQYAVTLVPGKITASQEQVVLYHDISTNTACFTARSAFNWNDATGASIVPQQVEVTDLSYAVFVNTLKDLGYSTGLLGLFSPDEFFGIIARFVFLFAGIATIGQFIFKGQWLDTILALVLIGMQLLYAQVEMPKSLYLINLFGWTLIALGLGSRTSRLALHVRQLDTIPNLPDEERAEAVSATRFWFLNFVEWNWGGIFWGVQIWFNLFAPTSKTLVSVLGVVGASAVAVFFVFLFDILEAGRRRSLVSNKGKKYADWLSLAVNLLATITACILILRVPDQTNLSLGLGILFCVVFIAGYVLNGIKERISERPFDMVFSVSLYVVGFLPWLATLVTQIR